GSTSKRKSFTNDSIWGENIESEEARMTLSPAQNTTSPPIFSTPSRSSWQISILGISGNCLRMLSAKERLTNALDTSGLNRQRISLLNQSIDSSFETGISNDELD